MDDADDFEDEVDTEEAAAVADAEPVEEETAAEQDDETEAAAEEDDEKES